MTSLQQAVADAARRIWPGIEVFPHPSRDALGFLLGDKGVAIHFYRTDVWVSDAIELIKAQFKINQTKSDAWRKT